MNIIGNVYIKHPDPHVIDESLCDVFKEWFP